MDRGRFKCSSLHRRKNKRFSNLVTPIQVKSPPPLNAKSSKDLLVLEQPTDVDADRRRVGEPIYRLLEQDAMTAEALIQYLIVHNEQIPSLSKAFWDDGVFRMHHKQVLKSVLQEILAPMVNEIVASQQVHFSQDFRWSTMDVGERQEEEEEEDGKPHAI